ncbi:putative vacuolar basic amino acid transporter 1 [Triangularia verruculosa]|uniref:Vacuolar basic amino acid transporter 1 n=1 Tax=Triangularia verruculosa TaxID=2587418 RepID=A0AAN6XII5_9PEZI|nr:putative vacuolar basic amino acid transporter 1 [Triangularia verruculosa]
MTVRLTEDRQGLGGDDRSYSSTTSATANEQTPLLGSDISSVTTARQISPEPEQTIRDGDGKDDERPPLGWKRGTAIILSMLCLIFFQAANMSGISTTQSSIAADLDSYQNAMWFTSSYMISVSSTAPLVGRLSMVFSPGVMVFICATWFAIGALTVSVAPTFGVFILGRVLCGVGSGGIMTLCMILVMQLTSKKKRGLWIGLVNAGFTIGVSTGAVVFGALLPVIGWRLLFGFQAPLSFFAGLGVALSIPHRPSTHHNRDKSLFVKLAGIDYLGALTLTATITALLYSLSTYTRAPLAISLLSFALFLRIESRHPDPIIPLHIFSSRGILLSCLSQLCFMASRWTVLFYAPIFILAVRGLSPALAGSVLIPTNLGFGIGGLLVGWLHIKRSGSFWLPSLIALSIFSCSLFEMSFVSNSHTQYGVYIAVLFINGLCTGAALNYTLAHLLHLAPTKEHFIVTGLLATFRGFAGSFGTGIGGGVFNRILKGALTRGFLELGDGALTERREKLIAVLIGSPAAVWQEGVLSETERQVAVGGYEMALRGLYICAAGVTLLVLALQAGTGWRGPGEEKKKRDEEDIRGAVAEADPAMET